ncbi:MULTISPECIES: hypothetical protein [Aerosakkonema]|uniref:hypothetical protein n=1 Tax=Aerosakkonema TaxID=1246629 RepID=UPI0035B9767C
MFNLHRLQKTTAALIALGMTATTAAPIIVASPALAQSRVAQSQRYDYRLPSGTNIPVRYEEADKIVLAPDETARITLTVADDVLGRDGSVLIPSGSQVEGQIEPYGRGSRFVARNLIIDRGSRRSIDATSNVITRTQEVSRGGTNTTSILTGAAVGSAAAALISGVTGDRRIRPLEVLAGTGVGAAGGLLLGRNRDKAKVVIIDPDSDLDLKLRSDLVLSSYGYNSRSNSDYDSGRYSRPSSRDDRGI